MSKVILCDIDGTVANNDHRQHLLGNYKDWNKFFDQMHLDEPINRTIALIKELHNEKKEVIFLTGRPERYREKTIKWLKKYFKFHINLYMRKDGDTRDKLTVKKEIFDLNFSDSDIETIIDNDKELIEMWENLNHNVIDVNNID